MTAAINSYTRTNYEYFLNNLLAGNEQLKPKQTETINGYHHRMQTMRKQAIALDCVDNTLHEVYVKGSLVNVETILVSNKPIDGFTHCRMMTDLAESCAIISDGTKIRSYRMARRVKCEGGLTAYRPTVCSNRAAVDADGNPIQRDARGHLHLFLNVYYENDPYNTRDHSQFVKEYLLQLLMWDEEARETLRNALYDFSSGDLVVNHMNNDTRDLNYMNLEFCTSTMNTIHAAIVKDIVTKFPRAGYSFQIFNGCKQVTRWALKFRLSIQRSMKADQEVKAVYRDILMECYPQALQ